VGDTLDISVGISFCPHPRVKQREDLFNRARSAYRSAETAGGVIVSRD
jgi:hypothetical protein